MRRGQPTRRLTTVLFTDIVGSTEIAAELGDERWRRLQDRHHAIVRDEFRRFRGREVDSAGDGFLATFEEPTDAVRCAWSISGRLRELGLGIRAGAHTGGVEVTDGRVGGIAVHIAARIMALARGEEILVSATVRDLLAGSGIELEDRGEHELKGVPGTWRALAVSSVVGEKRRPPLDPSTASTLRSEASEELRPQRGRRPPLPVLVGVGVAVAVAVALLLTLPNRQDPTPTRTDDPGGVLLEVDPETGEILQRIPVNEVPPLNAPADLAVEGGRVWMIRGVDGDLDGGNAIARIDPETGDLSSVIEIGDPLGTQQVVVGGRAVWVLGFDPGAPGIRLAQIDLTGKVLNRIEIGGASAGFGFAAGFDFGEDALWIATNVGELVRVDALTGEATDTRKVASSAGGVATDADIVWVLDNLRRELIPVDPLTLRAGRAIELPSQSSPES